MSLSVGAGMAIAGGISAATAGGSAVMQTKLNKKNRQWQEKMYYQRLADDRENWNIQNAYNEEMYLKYNSPEALARQYREAAINPDLNGVDSSGISGGASLGSAPDAGSAPYQSAGFESALGQISQIGQLFMMYNQMESAKLDNDAKKAALRDTAKSTAMQYFLNTYTPEGENGPIPDSDYILDSSSVSGKSAFVKNLMSQGMSKSMARSVARFLSRGESSFSKSELDTEYYKRKRGTEQERSDLFKLLADPDYSENDDEFTDSITSFLQLKRDIDKVLLGASKAKGNYDRNYYNSADGTKAGQAFNADSDERINQKQSWNDIFKYIDEYEKSHDSGFSQFLAGAMRIALLYSRSKWF